jgi:uncharacterized repeat protein (TIGR01451 family)
MSAMRDTHPASSRISRARALRAAVATAAGVGLWAVTAGSAMAVGPSSSTTGGITTVSFTDAGCTTWTVPAGVSAVQIQAIGAAGTDGVTGPPSGTNNSVAGHGGLGDGVSGTLSGLSGGTQALDVCVDVGGGHGAIGVNSGNGGGDGGGASGVSLGSDFSAALLVAGAGAGGGGQGLGNGGNGGSAGTPVAGSGGSPTGGQGSGGNNTAQTGGAGGAGNPACVGSSGGQFGPTGPGRGGDNNTTSVCGNGGGGGGGGYFGGGAGASAGAGGGGGGGGTDFCAPALTDCAVTSGAGTSHAAGADAGEAQVILIYAEPDSTGPTDAPAASPAANANGWNNTQVAVAWNWTDAGSGIDPANCTQSSSSTGEGVQSLSASCADLAGNSSSDSLQVKVDQTKPVDNPVVTTTSTGASVAWNWSDSLSGVDAASCTQSSSQTGTGQLTLTSSCTDLAGNTATDSKTVTVTQPANKADVQVKVSGPATGKRNTGYTYTVTTKNAGPGAAADVVSTVLLPSKATLVSSTGSPVRIGPLVTWTASSLASGASVSYTVTVKLPCTGTWVFGAAAASLPTRTVPATPDPHLLNNIAAVRTKIS